MTVDYKPNKQWRQLYYIHLKTDKLNGLHQLIYSLEKDGRFYGAEIKQEDDELAEYMYWVVFEKQKFFKESLGVKYD
jgi:hypothetical protein